MEKMKAEGHKCRKMRMCLLTLFAVLAAAIVLFGVNTADDSSADIDSGDLKNGTTLVGHWTYDTSLKVLELQADPVGGTLFTISNIPWGSYVSQMTTINTHDFKGSSVTAFDLSAYTNLQTISGSVYGSPNSKWEYSTQTRTLTVTGTATAMGGYATGGADVPWAFCPGVSANVEYIVIEKYTSVGSNVFKKSMPCLISISSNSIESIGYADIFGGLVLQNITLTNLKSITADSAFSGCGASTINLGNNDLDLSSRKTTFSNCSNLTTITSGITKLGQSSFLNCKKLVTVQDGINDGYTTKLTNVGDSCFSGCSVLKTFNAPSCTTMGTGVFSNCTAIETIIVAMKTVGTQFQGMTTLKTLIVKATGIDFTANCLKGCASLMKVSSSETGTALDALYIRSYAFQNCSSLTELDVPNVSSIDTTAFSGCPLEKVRIGLQSMNACLREKTSLKEVVLNRATSLADYTFFGCTALKKLSDGITVVEDGEANLPKVTSFGSYCFGKCISLTDMTLTGQSALYYGVFAYCTSLEHVTLGNVTTWYDATTTNIFSGSNETIGMFTKSAIQTVTAGVLSDKIGSYSFWNIETLTTFTCISTASISTCAFYNCSALTGFDAGDKLKTVGDSAFRGCSSLAYFRSTSANFTTIGEMVFLGCSNSGFTKVKFDYVTTIGRGAYQNCTNLTEIDFAAVKTIYNEINPAEVGGNNQGVFYNCPLEKINLPSVETIGTSAFRYIKTLSTVNAFPALKTVNSYAFYDTNLASFTSGNTLTTIGSYAFAKCTSLTEFNAGNGLQTINTYAFQSSSSLVTFTCGNALEHIYESAFNGCSSLQSFPVSDALVDISYYAFYKCISLKSFTAGDALTTVYYQAFYQCSALESFTAGNGLMYLYYHGTSDSSQIFYQCTSLREFTCGSGLKVIGNSTFSGCTALEEFTTTSTVLDRVCDSAFVNCTSLTTFKCENNPAGTRVIASAFNNCQSMNSCSLGTTASVSYIGGSAFYNCQKLPGTFNISGVTIVYSSAFRYCKALEHIVADATLTTIQNDAFRDCIALQSFTYTCDDDQISLTEIMNNAFSNDQALLSFEGGDVLGNIGSEVFTGCTVFTSFTCGRGAVIGSKAFYQDTNMITFEGPHVTSVGSSAFAQTAITMFVSDSLTTVNDSAFASCGQLKYVSAGKLTGAIGSYAFNGCKLLGTDRADPSTEILGMINAPDVTSIRTQAFNGCENIQYVVTNATNIESYAFLNCKALKTVELAQGSTATVQIAGYAFANCYALSINTGFENVAGLGSLAFVNCTSPTFTTANMPKLTSLGACAFYGCTSLNKITFPALVTTPDQAHDANYMGSDYRGVFQGTAITSIEPGDLPLVNYLGSRAFLKETSLKYVCMPELRTISTEAFRESGLLEIRNTETNKDLPKVEEIKNTAFYSCTAMTKISFPSLVTLGQYVFSYSGVKSVSSENMPNVTFLGYQCFAYCPSLDTINFTNVTSTDSYVFIGCALLKNVSLPQLTTLKGHMFYDCDALLEITETSLPKVSLMQGGENFRGCNYLNTVVMNSLTSVSGSLDFYDDGALKYVEMNKLPTLQVPSTSYPSLFTGANYIETYYLDSLESVHHISNKSNVKYFYAKTATSIQKEAMKDMTNLLEVDLSNVTTLYENVFYNTGSKMAILSLPSLTTITSGAFSNCKAPNLSIGTLMKATSDFGLCGTSLKSIEFLQATSIDAGAFTACSQLETIRFKDMVKVPVMTSYFYNGGKVIKKATFDNATEIANIAFQNFSSLETISFPSLTTFGTKGIGAFAGCSSLKNITSDYFPVLTKLPKGIFSTSLDAGNRIIETVTLDSVEELDEFAFKNFTLLTTVNMNHLKVIGNGAFDGCVKFNNVRFDSIETLTGGFAGNQYIKTINFPNMTSMDAGVFSGCTSLTLISCPRLEIIPSNAFNGCVSLAEIDYDGSSRVDFSIATTIGIGAFSGCSKLASINFPLATIIDGTAFNGCPLESVSLGAIIEVTNFLNGIATLSSVAFDSATTVKANAFTNCTSLQTVNAPNLTTIEGSDEQKSGAFSGCTKLGSVNFASVKDVGPYAFSGCIGVTSVTLNEVGRVSGSILGHAFEGCSALTTVKMQYVRELSEYMFKDCVALNNLTLDAVNTIGKGVFSGCIALQDSNITSFADTVMSIGELSFYGCITLTQATFRNASFKTIPGGAFANCTGLTSLTVPYVDTIGDAALVGTDYVGAFSGCSFVTVSNATFGQGSSPTVTTIGSYAFSRCMAMTGISLSAVTAIRDHAFYYCEALSAIGATDFANVTIIGNYGFAHCGTLTSIAFSNLNTIGDYAFEYNAGLESVSTANLINVGSHAFERCERLQDITLQSVGKTVGQVEAVVGQYIFSECRLLKTVALPELTYVPAYMFNSCERLTTYTFSTTGVTDVREGAFRGCSAITAVSFDKAITIGELSFENCGLLDTVSLPEVTSIGLYAFAGCSSLKVVSFPKIVVVPAHVFSNYVVVEGAKVDQGNNSMTSVEFSGATSIAARAFYSFTALQMISFERVSLIGEDAFTGCSSLTNVSFPKVQDVPAGVFAGNTALEIVNFAGAKTIAAESFKGCSHLSTVTFSLVETVGADAFMDCPSLKIVSLPRWGTITGDVFTGTTAITHATFAGATSVVKDAFKNSASLQSISAALLENGNESAFEGCTALKDVSLPKLKQISTRMFYGCTSLDTIRLPAAEGIGEYAFSESGLTVISAGDLDVVSTIGTSTGNGAFYKCINLTSVTMPGLTTISNNILGTVPGSPYPGAFEGCSVLESVTFVKLATVGIRSFQDCIVLDGLNDSTVPSVNIISEYAFAGCSAISAVKFRSLTEAGDYAFYNCTNLGEIANDSMSSLNNIGEYTFAGCSRIASVSFSDKLTKIGVGAFSGCSILATIDKANFPKVTELPEDVFANCAGLQAVTFSSVTDIHVNAFRDSNGLQSVTMESLTKLTTTVFKGKTSLKTLNFPVATEIVAEAFAGCTGVDNVVFPALKTINERSFYGCKALTTVAMNAVTIVGNNAFRDCDGLRSVTMISANRINAQAFSGCLVLNTMRFDSLTTIGEKAFYGCRGLNTIPSTSFPKVVTISSCAFAGCTTLREAHFPAMVTVTVNIFNDLTSSSTSMGNSTLTSAWFDSATVVNASAFQNYTALKEIHLRQEKGQVSVSTINEYAFQGCTSLTEIESDFFPIVTNVGTGAFAGCTKLTSASFPGMTKVTANMFDMPNEGNAVLETVTFDNALEIAASAFLNYTALSVINCPKVISFGSRPFDGCTSYIHVIFPGVQTVSNTFEGNEIIETVDFAEAKSIGSAAFRNCTSLESVRFPKVTHIEDNAFNGCTGLHEVRFESVQVVGTLFRGVENIQKVYFDGASEVQESAFENCTGLVYVSMSNVSIANEGAFRGCSNLMEVYMGNLERFSVSMFENCKSLSAVTDDSFASVSGVESYAFRNCTGLVTVSLSQLQTAVGENVFDGCPILTSVNLPALEAIGKNMFYGCTNLSIINSENFTAATEIKDGAFYGCSGLKTVSFMNVQTIGAEAFRKTGLTAIDGSTGFPSVEIIGASAFRECSSLGNNGTPVFEKATEIGDFAFCTTKILSISATDFPNVKTIGLGAFAGCNNLASVNFPSVEVVPTKVFSTNIDKDTPRAGNNKITSVSFAAATELDPYAFQQFTMLSSIDFPSVTTIGTGAFDGCSALKIISFPSVKIVTDVFKGNKVITSATFAAAEEINENAFSGCSALKTVSFPTVSTIWKKSFADCTSLTTIPEGAMDNVQTISEGAFSGCKVLASVTFPNALTLGPQAFFNCTALSAIEETSLPKVKTIGEGAFSNCVNLTRIIMPKVESIGTLFASNSVIKYISMESVSKLDSRSLYRCTSLQTALFDGAKSIGSEAFLQCSKLDTVSFNSAATIGNRAFQACTSLTTASFPGITGEIASDIFQGNGVFKNLSFPNAKSIRAGAFANCTSLESISIPSATTAEDEVFRECGKLSSITLTSLQQVPARMFENCVSLTAIQLPAATWIKTEAFKGCSSLKNITDTDMPKVNTVGENSTLTNKIFSECSSLIAVSLPMAKDIYGPSMFQGCDQLTTVNMPSATTLNEYMFAGCTSLVNIESTRLKSVETIGDHAFEGCINLTSVSFESATVVGNYSFSGCNSLSNIKESQFGSVVTVGDYAFSECGLSNVVFGSLQSAGEGAFNGCKFIDIPDTSYPSLTAIGPRMFSSCTTLSNISMPSVQTIESDSFDGCSSLIKIEFPAVTTVGAMFKGKTSITTATFAIAETIEDNAFNGCTSLSTISFPNVTSIGENAFKDCRGLKTLVSEGVAVFNNVETIGTGAFTKCTNLSVIKFPTVTSVGDSSFNGCTSLKALTDDEFPELLTIGASAFSGCTNIADINLSNVRTIGDNAFSGCKVKTVCLPSVTDVNTVFQGNVNLVSAQFQKAKTIKSKAFKGCSALSYIEFPAVETIEANSFDGCSSLKEISFPSVKSVPAVFKENKYIESVAFATATTILEGAFSNCTGLKTVSFPLVSEIGNSFDGCDNLVEISFPSVTIIPAEVFAGMISLEKATFDKAITVSSEAFTGCTALATVSIPKATSIGASAFEGCSSLVCINSFDKSGKPVEEVLIDVEIIGECAFMGSGIKKIAATLPAGSIATMSIGNKAFKDCVNLKYADLGVETLISDSEMFDGCQILETLKLTSATSFSYNFAGHKSLKEVYIENVSSFAGSTGLFKGCTALKSVYLRNVAQSATAVTIEKEMFYGCTALTFIELTNVKGCGESAFEDCTSLKTAAFSTVINSSYVNKNVFKGCTSLTTANIGSMTSVSEGMFYGCTALTNITMNKAEIVGPNAFYGCVAIKSLKSTSITKIESNAFARCSSLGTVEMTALSNIGEYAFSYCTSLSTVVLNSTEITMNITIGSYAFNSCGSLSDINFERVKTLETYAFIGCTGFKILDIKEVTDVEDYAFSGCSNLSSIKMDKVKHLGTDVFYECSSITEISMNGIEEIEAAVFANCTTLVSVSMNSIKSLGARTFYGCSGLTTIGDTAGKVKMPMIKTISTSTFENCSKLSEITFGPYLESVGERAFYGCAAIREIVLPNSTKAIGVEAFSSTVLSYISIPDSVKSIGKNAFETSYATSLDVYLSCDPHIIKESFLYVTTTNTQFKLSLHLSNEYDDGTIDLSKYIKYGTKKYTPTQTFENAGRLTFMLKDTLSGHTLTYGTVIVIDGSKMILPYEEGDAALGVDPIVTFFGMFYSDVSDSGLGIITSEADYLLDGNFAQSCDIITMHITSYETPDLYVIGDQDNGSGDYFLYEVTIKTTDGINVDVTLQENLHYGSVVKIPKPTDEGVKLTGMLISPGGYKIPYDGSTFILGSYVDEITPLTGNVIFTIVYYDGDAEPVTVPQNYNDTMYFPEYIGKVGYVADGWYTKPNGQGEKMSTESKVTRNMSLYVYYVPAEYEITITSGGKGDDVTVKMYGQYMLYVQADGLAYTDVNVTDKKIIYTPSTKMPGYNVTAYCKPGSYIEPMTMSESGNGPYTGTNFVYLLVEEIKYSMKLEFYCGETEIVEVEIEDLLHGHENDRYQFGDIITGYNYPELKEGVKVALARVEGYVFSNIQVFSLDGTEIKTVPTESDGSSVIVYSDFRNQTGILLKFNFESDKYRIKYVYHDDDNTVAWNSDLLSYNEGGYCDTFIITTASFCKNVGYTFVTWYIGSQTASTYKEYAVGAHTIDRDMVNLSEENIITFHAKWERLDYTIKFDTGESQDVIDPITGILIDEKVDISSTYDITLKGHTLLGWQWVNGDLASKTFHEDEIILDKEIIDTYGSSDRVLTLKADWTKNGYTIRADPNDVASYGGQFPDIKNVQSGDTFTIWDQGYALKDYHTFNGWYTEDDLDMTIYKGEVVIDEKLSAIGDDHDGVITFRMSWVKIQYYIYFDAGDTGSSYLYGPYAYGDDINRPDGKSLVNEGYEFKGWSLTKNDISEYRTDVFDAQLAHSAAEEYKVSGQYIATMYPVWIKKSYTLEYDFAGGISGKEAPLTANYGDEITINNPTRVGFTFLGWTASGLTPSAVYKDSFGNKVAWKGDTYVKNTTFINLNSDQGKVIMTANWTYATYGTVFDANGGVGETRQGQTVAINAEIDLPDLDDYSMVGYTASGWSYDKVNVMTSNVFDTKMASMADDLGNVTFYVIWAPTMYNVTLSYTSAISDTRQVLYDNVLTLSDPSSMNVGYTFNGWSGSGIGDEAAYSYDGVTWQHWTGGVVQAYNFKNLSSEGATSGIVVSANWTAIEYNIIYDANGGTGAPTDSRKYTIGMKISEPSVSQMTNGNKTFKGWALTSDATGTTNVSTFDRTFASAAQSNAVTFYAVWTESNYKTVYVNLDGSTPDHVPDGWEYNEETGTYSKEFDKNADKSTYLSDWSDVVLTKSGQTFSSWSTSTSGDTVLVTAKYDEVNMSNLYIFIGVFAAAIIGILIFVRIER